MFPIFVMLLAFPLCAGPGGAEDRALFFFFDNVSVKSGTLDFAAAELTLEQRRSQDRDQIGRCLKRIFELTLPIIASL